MLLLLLKVFMSPLCLPLEISCLRALELIASSHALCDEEVQPQNAHQNYIYHSLCVVITPGWNIPFSGKRQAHFKQWDG
jgi:hypothetical protein